MPGATCNPETPGDARGPATATEAHRRRTGEAPGKHRDEGALKAETKLKGSVPDP
jgi:hypothetical protein